MGAFIIYATLMANGMIGTIEFKKGSFQSEPECIRFLSENNDLINTTLKDHISKREPNAVVLFIGCAERYKLIQRGEST